MAQRMALNLSSLIYLTVKKFKLDRMLSDNEVGCACVPHMQTQMCSTMCASGEKAVCEFVPAEAIQHDTGGSLLGLR